MAVGTLHGLVSQAGGAAVHQRLGEGGIRGQVEEREQDMPGLEPQILLTQRFFDLGYEVRLSKDGSGVGYDAGSRRDVGFVGEERALTRPVLDQDLMAPAGQFLRPGGREGDPILVLSDLGRYSDSHLDLFLRSRLSDVPA